MTETTTDYLYVIPPQLQDRSFAASTSDKDGSFDDHLSQAASNASEENRTSSGSSQRDSRSPGTEPLDQNVQVDQTLRPAGSIPKPAAEQRNTGTAQSSRTGTAEHPADGEQKEAQVNQGQKQEEREKRDHSTEAQLAAGTHLAVQNEHKQRTIDSPKVKATTESIPVAPEPSKPPASSARELANTLDKNHLQPASLELDAGDKANDPSIARATDDQFGETTAAPKQTKTQKSKIVSKAGLATTENEPLQGDSAPEHSLDDKVPAEAGQNANRVTTVTVNDLKAKAETASDDKTSDASHHDATKDAKAAPASSTADHTSKVDAAQIVNATALSPTESTPATVAKHDKDEQAVKPIAGTNESAAASFARLSRAGAGIGRESGLKSADDLPQVDPSRFVGRVAKAFQTAQERGGSLQIRLSPPELGALRLELTVKDGVMSASLQTENSSARRLLLDHLPTLRDRLAEQNIRVDRFDVDVRREGSGSQADARGSQHQQFQHQAEQPSPRRQFASRQQVHESAAPDIDVVPNISDAGLNLII